MLNFSCEEWAPSLVKIHAWDSDVSKKARCLISFIDMMMIAQFIMNRGPLMN